MKKTISTVLVAAVTVSLLGSCASILNGKSQKMTINTDHVDNEVYVNDSLIGTGKTVSTKFKRDFEAKEIRIEREGYETKNYAVIQTKKSPLYFFSVVPFAITFYAPLYDSHPKAFNYPRELPEFGTESMYVEQQEGNKHIYVNSCDIELEVGNFTMEGVPYKNYIKGDMTPGNFAGSTSNTEQYKAEGIGMESMFNEILIDRGFADTSKTILKKKNNTLYLDVDLIKWNNYNIYKSFINAGASSFMIAKLEFKWTLRDAYKNILFEETVQTTTDEFRAVSFGYVGTKNNTSYTETIQKVMKNGMEKSLISFLSGDQVQEFLPMNKGEELTDNFNVSKGTAKRPSKLSEAIKACATVKLDKSHGSGLFINDNLLLTNYHVVAGKDTLTVITNDSKTLKATVVRKSENNDLAILKVIDYKAEYFIDLKSIKESEIGEEVYAIGTPSSIEFTQTLSKGIISGHRKTSEVDLIQTDVSINPGNSGGPLVNSKGELIGIVNSKLVGTSVEGIGFAIPGVRIAEYLKLTVE